MGRHKDPETLQFIETCKKKAEALGFRVNDEFKVLNGLFWVDLTLTPYGKGHDTFITMEIETKENDRIYKNLDKIFDLPAKDLEKPYQHFIVIYRNSLSKGNKQLMLEKARKCNVHIFENLKNEHAQLEQLYKELEDLKIEISSYIERKGKVSPAETIQETILGLGKVAPVLIVENRLYHINGANLTSGFQTIQGKPAHSAIAQLFESKKYKQFAIVPIPRKICTLIVPSTAVAFQTYIEAKSNHTSISLTLETCDYPFLVNIELMKGNGGTTSIKIDPNEADVVQLKKFEDFQRAMTDKKTIEIYDQNTNLVCRCEEMQSNYNSSKAWYDDVSNLAHIQITTSTRISAPKNLVLTAEDHNMIFKIKKIIDEGEFSGQLKKLAFKGNKEILLKLVETQKTRGSIPDLKLCQKQVSEQLLNQDIPLGELIIELPEMIFQESIENVKRRIDEIDFTASTEVVFIPKSSGQFKAVYPKWKKAQEKQLNTATT
jgi:hypothetical protein